MGAANEMKPEKMLRGIATRVLLFPKAFPTRTAVLMADNVEDLRLAFALLNPGEELDVAKCKRVELAHTGDVLHAEDAG